MPASHFDVTAMTGRPKFIVRHSTFNRKKKFCLLDIHDLFGAELAMTI
jgi:hypothetical protein